MSKSRETDVPISMNTDIELASLAQGQLADVFARDLGRIVENLADPDTRDGEARIYTIKMTMKPTDDRSAVRVEIETTFKPARERSVVTAFALTRDGKNLRLTESAEMEDPDLIGADGETIVD